MTSVLSATPYATSSAGLHKKKPTYEELINYIERDPAKIRYPDRQATVLRNSQWLTQLDGEGQNQLETQIAMERRNAFRNGLLQQVAGALILNLALLHHVVHQLNLHPVFWWWRWRTSSSSSSSSS